MENKEQKIFYKNRNVLVAGGCGFIGSFLVQKLVGYGAKVFVLDKSGVDTWRIKNLRNKIKIIEDDLKDREFCKRTLAKEKISLIFNLSGNVDTSQNLLILEKLIGDNFTSTLNLLNIAIVSGVSKFVQVGTIDEYGQQEAPFYETQRENPVSPYAISKVMATHLALLFNKSLDFDVCVVRPAATFGPKQNLGMLTPNLIKSCIEKKDFTMNSGEQMRDLIYVEDLVEGITIAGLKEEAFGQIINLGNYTFYKIRDVAETINKLMGNPIKIHFAADEYRPLDNTKHYLNSDKARQLLGWEACTKIDVGMKKTIDWYQKSNFFEKLSNNK